MNRYRVDIVIYLVSALFLIGAVSLWWHGVWPSSSGVVLEPFGQDGIGTGLEGYPVSGGSGPGDQGDDNLDNGSPSSGLKDGSPEVPTIVVHVAGAVLRPGVYELIEGQRVHNAIELAGAADDADLVMLNLAAVLRDSDKVYVPRKGESLRPGWTGMAGTSGAGAGSTGGGNSGSGGVSFPINLNTATAKELEALPGIGPSLANAIITYRTEHGPFKDPHDVVAVPGIGEKTYQKMAPLIVVR